MRRAPGRAGAAQAAQTNATGVLPTVRAPTEPLRRRRGTWKAWSSSPRAAAWWSCERPPSTEASTAPSRPAAKPWFGRSARTRPAGADTVPLARSDRAGQGGPPAAGRRPGRAGAGEGPGTRARAGCHGRGDHVSVPRCAALSAPNASACSAQANVGRAARGSRARHFRGHDVVRQAGARRNSGQLSRHPRLHRGRLAARARAREAAASRA